MWEEIVGGIERRSQIWKLRTLSLKGKVLILNVLMVSNLWYVSYVTAIPMWVKKRLKHFIFIFLWNGKPPRIAYNTLIGEAGKGGMGLIDVEQRKNCLRVKVIKKYRDEESKTARKKTMGYFLNKCGNFNLGDNILWMKTKNWMVEGLPGSYKKSMSA